MSEDGGTAVEAVLAFAESSPETTRTRTLTWQDPAADSGKLLAHGIATCLILGED